MICQCLLGVVHSAHTRAQHLLRCATIWPQLYIRHELKGGWGAAVPLYVPGGGAGSPCSAVSPGPRPTSIPTYQVACWSIQLFGNSTATLQTGQTGQWSHVTGWTVTCNGRPKNLLWLSPKVLFCGEWVSKCSTSLLTPFCRTWLILEWLCS